MECSKNNEKERGGKELTYIVFFYMGLSKRLGSAKNNVKNDLSMSTQNQLYFSDTIDYVHLKIFQML